jgi:hypothetical protein
MTTPSERTRALCWAREFLTEVESSPDVSTGLRDQATAILRHYPDVDDIERFAGIEAVSGGVMAWLAPNDVNE